MAKTKSPNDFLHANYQKAEFYVTLSQDIFFFLQKRAGLRFHRALVMAVCRRTPVKSCRLGILAVGAQLLSTLTSVAGLNEVSPYSWTEISQNGKYIFVGVSAQSVDNQVKAAAAKHQFSTDAERDAFEGKLLQIHSRYEVSGMYSTSGSLEPLWTFTLWEDHGFPTSDGEKLIVIGEGGQGNLSRFDIARVFDRNGLQFELALGDLVPFWQQWVRRWSGAEYPLCQSVALNRSEERLIVSRNFGDILEVSLKNGKTVTSNALSNTLRVAAASWAVAVVGTSIIATIVLWRVFRRRHPRKKWNL